MAELSLIAYHGTSSDRAKLIIQQGFDAKPRAASWLGDGQYFFYRARGHAENWAKMVADRPKPKAANAVPVVIASEIDLSACVDLLDNRHWQALRTIAQANITQSQQVGVQGLFHDPQPQNIFSNVDDCRLINAYAEFLSQQAGQPVTTVMAAFIEGDPVFANSWLFDRSHVCVSVRDRTAIKVRHVYRDDGAGFQEIAAASL